MGSRSAVGLLVAFVACAPEDVYQPNVRTGGGGSTTTHAAGPRVALGATVLLQPSGRVVATNPDTDTVRLLVHAPDGSLRPSTEISLGAGARPTVTAGTKGFVVVARGTGSLAWFGASGALLQQTKVCSEPRGVALDAAEAVALVACASGELVTVSSSGEVTNTLETSFDLRDVLRFDATTAWVTTHRSAQVLQLDRASGGVLTTLVSPGVTTPTGLHFSPQVAARTVLVGEVAYMAHQLELDGDVRQLTAPGTVPGPVPVVPQYYGAGNGCMTSVVSVALTRFDLRPGHFAATTVALPGAVPVDVAVQGPWAAVATMGGLSTVITDAWVPTTGCGTVASNFLTLQPPLAVGLPTPAVPGPIPVPMVLTRDSLGGYDLHAPTEEPAARALFHTQSPSGVACQSCHAEGYDDGHVWTFEQPVRTQSLEGGLLATAPFHWKGELQGFADVVHLTFETRMGGHLPADLSANDLGAWLDTLPARQKPMGDVSAGEKLFTTAGCATCHAGASLTSNATVDVGTGGAFQVPSLRGVGFRGPWMHSGCAKTLAQRFDPACGGKEHGGPVAPADVPELVRYLQSL